MLTVPTSGLVEPEGVREGVMVRGYTAENGQVAWYSAGKIPLGCRCSVDVGLPIPASLVFAADFWNIETGIELCVSAFWGSYFLTHCNGNLTSLVLAYISLARSCLSKPEVSQWRQLERPYASNCLEYGSEFAPISHNDTKSWFSSSYSTDSATTWSSKITVSEQEKGIFHSLHLQCVGKGKEK